MTLRHFKYIFFFMAYFVYQNVFIVFNAYCKSLIKTSQCHLDVLTTIFHYLSIKKIVVNITDFPVPFKI